MQNSLLNNPQSCATIHVSLSDYNELLRRIEILEHIVISGRREALCKELGFLEDGMRLERTVKRRVR